MHRRVEWYLVNTDWCESAKAGSYDRELLGTGKVESML